MDEMDRQPGATFRSLLVHVDDADGAADRVRLAARLADAWGVHLTGAAAAEEFVPLYAEGGYIPADMMDMEVRRVDLLVERAKALFEREAANVRSRAWRSAHWPASLFVVEEARGADLVIVGHEAPGGARDPAFSAGDVILAAGRPVLVVPANVDRLEARRIVVAWKDTREIRRALSDAMPLLRAAQEVVVVTVSREVPEAPWDDLKAYLARHGVTASFVHRAEAEGGAPEAVGKIAAAHGADLIVAGAYGRWKWRERLFGGVTLDLLTTASVCCLLSH